MESAPRAISAHREFSFRPRACTRSETRSGFSSISNTRPSSARRAWCGWSRAMVNSASPWSSRRMFFVESRCSSLFSNKGGAGGSCALHSGEKPSDQSQTKRKALFRKITLTFSPLLQKFYDRRIATNELHVSICAAIFSRCPVKTNRSGIAGDHETTISKIAIVMKHTSQ